MASLLISPAFPERRHCGAIYYAVATLLVLGWSYIALPACRQSESRAPGWFVVAGSIAETHA